MNRRTVPAYEVMKIWVQKINHVAPTGCTPPEWHTGILMDPNIQKGWPFDFDTDNHLVSTILDNFEHRAKFHQKYGSS